MTICADVTKLRRSFGEHWIVDSKKRIVFAKFGGLLTMADAERFATDLRNNPAFDPSFSELTEVENPQIDFASAARFARYSNPFSHESKRAIVTHIKVYGMTRTSQCL